MWDIIQSIDEQVLLFFQSIHNNFLDVFFWYISEAWVFIPLWLWALWKIFSNYNWKSFLKILVLASVTIFLSDQICNVSKYHFQRLRPTHHPVLKEKINLVNDYRGGTYGFYSAHASNSAGICVLSLLLIKKNRMKYIMILYPLLSGISRMYLGVHYFTDVLAGWTMGILISYGLYYFFKSVIRID